MCSTVSKVEVDVCVLVWCVVYVDGWVSTLNVMWTYMVL